MKSGIWNYLRGALGIAAMFVGSLACAQSRQQLPTVCESNHLYTAATLRNGKQLRLLVD